MLKMMRRNLLLDLGGLKSPWESEIIACPDAYKRKPVVGTIIGMGPQCRLDKSAMGRKVVFKAQHSEDLEIKPKEAVRYGLPEGYYMIVFEGDLESFV